MKKEGLLVKKKFIPQNDNTNTLPNEPGIYIICTKQKNKLPESMLNLEYKYFKNLPVVYLGISINLHRRIRNHFRGSARNSSFRKSLGNLLGYKEKRHYYNDGKYRFTNEYELLITQYIEDSFIAYYFTCQNYRNYESRLIDKYNPPLNLDNNHNIINAEFREWLEEQRK